MIPGLIQEQGDTTDPQRLHRGKCQYSELASAIGETT